MLNCNPNRQMSAMLTFAGGGRCPRGRRQKDGGKFPFARLADAVPSIFGGGISAAFAAISDVAAFRY